MSLQGLVVLAVLFCFLPYALFKNRSKNWDFANVSTHAIRETVSDRKMVKVEVYVESLCIDSQLYMSEQLMPTFGKLGDIMDLDLIVFGNAKLDVENAKLECQHGFGECDANAYQLCARDIYPFANMYIPFDACLFKSLPMGHHDDPFAPNLFANCARLTALDWNALVSCHADERHVWELQLAAALDTPSYHNYVPWVEIDGQHIDEDNVDLLSAICDAYNRTGGDYSRVVEACAESRVRDVHAPSSSVFAEIDRVIVGIYVESLCVYCKQYLEEQVMPTYELLKDYIDLNVVVFGNTMIDVANRSLDCQHGVAECDANAYHGCTRDVYSDTGRYLPFTACLFQTLPMGYSNNEFGREAYADCARRSALDWNALVTCRLDENHVWKLQQRAWKETPSDHQYVPWAVVDGRHIDQEDEDLMASVCDAIKTRRQYDDTPSPPCPEFSMKRR
jgi:interferon gamma-inducible protein 30